VANHRPLKKYKMEKFTLSDNDNYLEDFAIINLKDIPDCKGKADIADENGRVNCWDWLILSLTAKITKFNDIFENRETDNPKYNFVWQIVQSVLNSEKNNKELHEILDQAQGEMYLNMEIYPTFVEFNIRYNKCKFAFRRSKQVSLSTEQTVRLLESGIFTDIVDNRRKE
jgi:hypothetical protein